MSDNVVFLEIDGVLNSDSYFFKRYRNTIGLRMIDIFNLDEDDELVLSKLIDIDLDALERAIEITNSTNSKAVITSSWKELECYDKIKKHLINLGLPIVNKTLTDYNNRGKGIKEYLKNNNVDRYIIIDDGDFSDYDDELKSHLIRTSFNDGLSDEHVKKAIKLLNGKNLSINKK